MNPVNAELNPKPDVSEVLLGMAGLGRSLGLEPGDQLDLAEVDREEDLIDLVLRVETPGVVLMVQSPVRSASCVSACTVKYIFFAC